MDDAENGVLSQESAVVRAGNAFLVGPVNRDCWVGLRIVIVDQIGPEHFDGQSLAFFDLNAVEVVFQYGMGRVIPGDGGI